MIKSTIKSFIQTDLVSVWNTVTSIHDFSWRSDIASVSVSDKAHFNETSKNGGVTTFIITVVEPFIQYSFSMDNEYLSGEWTGLFKRKGKGTEIQFTESINPKRWWLYPFAWFYLKKQQKQYITDLKRKCEQNGRIN